MATIMIGSARHDENGKYTNGNAGDSLQKSSTNDTVGEVSMQNFYVHSKGWYIIRPKSITHANSIANTMKNACNNKNLGYDQNGRLGVITYGTSTTTKTECDCSSLVRQCVKEATGKDAGNFTTADAVTKLVATGLFENKVAYVSQTNTPIYNGDILCTKTKGHIVVVVSGNPRVSTSANNVSNTSSTNTTTTSTANTSFKVKVTVSALNIRSGAGTNYNVVGCIKDKGTYTITKTSGDWGYLKSGAGWINISSSYVKRV